jgi:hypothetical protein
VVVGLKLPEIEQLAPTARFDPQAFETENMEAFVPPTDIPLILSAELPILLSETIFTALRVFFS